MDFARNVETIFITNSDDPDAGSSLYIVSEHWVIRCSGNATGGRVPETFIRRRQIEYIVGENRFAAPSIGAYPREGEHDGNRIVAILQDLSRDREPPEWRSRNGVAWETAVNEIREAREYARITQRPRASRRVGAAEFQPD